MPTPIQLLEKKISLRKNALRAREVETAVREAELQEMEESLERLQSTHEGIRDAIEDALSESPTRKIAPTDLIETALEGSKLSNDNNSNNDASNVFSGETIQAGEVLTLALTSLRNDLGPKKLVEFIIESAVRVSGLDADGVTKAALATVRRDDLTISDVVHASLEASNSLDQIRASDIICPAVNVAMMNHIEPPVIIKEAFVNAVRMGDRAIVRTSVLSVLGCAMGMGINYRDLMGILQAFANEMKLREVTEMGQRITAQAAESSKSKQAVRAQQPPNAHSAPKRQPFSMPQLVSMPQAAPKPQEPKQAPGQLNKDPGNRDNLDAKVVFALVEAALENTRNGGPGLAALRDPSGMMAQWPREYSEATTMLDGITNESAKASDGSAKKRKKPGDLI